MEIPSDLVEQARNGRIVLFLGAGASRGARNRQGKQPPLGDELRVLIVKRFLTEKHSSDNLAWVAEFASSTSNLFTVQDFIAEQFVDLKPAEFHHLIPTFRWRGIATTNYDRLIEAVYGASHNALQSIVPFLSDSDRVDEKLRNPSSLALLKLHGCITRTHDEKLPLILTADQYASYRESRVNVFRMFEGWASENTVVFIGHAVQDPNLRAVLLNLAQITPSRPRYYLVRRGFDAVERDLWAGKNISTLDGTFEEFLKALDSAIPKQWRPLQAIIELDHPIHSRFIVKEKTSLSLIEFLDNDVEYVHAGIAVPEGAPSKFYSGFCLGWYAVINNLDVRRGLTDHVLEEVILRPEADRPSQSELYVIKAEAGAGKTILLRRIAWEAATSAGALCLYSRGTASPSFEALRELYEAAGDRIFYFIDNAADHVAIIRGVLEFARVRKIRVTIITTERSNEWNNACESIEDTSRISFHSITLVMLKLKNWCCF